MELVVDRPEESAVEKQEAEQIVGIGFLMRPYLLVEIIEAGDGVQPVAGIEQLKLLA